MLVQADLIKCRIELVHEAVRRSVRREGSYERALAGQNEKGHEMPLYGLVQNPEDAVPHEAKKNRGVSPDSTSGTRCGRVPQVTLLTRAPCSGPLDQGDVTAAAGPIHPNGGEVRMGLERFATLVAYTTQSWNGTSERRHDNSRQNKSTCHESTLHSSQLAGHSVCYCSGGTSSRTSRHGQYWQVCVQLRAIQQYGVQVTQFGSCASLGFDQSTVLAV